MPGRTMVKLETALTRLLWREVGGTLYEDFPLAIRGRNNANAPRTLHGLIDKGGPLEISDRFPGTMIKKDLVVILAKSKGAGVFSTVEALSAIKLVDRHHQPRSIEGYIVCLQEDEVLRAIINAEYPFLHMKVYGPQDLKTLLYKDDGSGRDVPG